MPARCSAGLSGRTVRMPPWNPLTKPTPATTSPTQRPISDVVAVATRVMLTPTIRPKYLEFGQEWAVRRLASEGGGPLGSGVEAADVVLYDVRVIFRGAEVRGRVYPPGPIVE